MDRQEAGISGAAHILEEHVHSGADTLSENGHYCVSYVANLRNRGQQQTHRALGKPA